MPLRAKTAIIRIGLLGAEGKSPSTRSTLTPSRSFRRVDGEAHLAPELASGSFRKVVGTLRVPSPVAARRF